LLADCWQTTLRVVCDALCLLANVAANRVALDHLNPQVQERVIPTTIRAPG
jgi:hypothetical protein